jgi:5-methylcytosine-specific restriction endonuclease McrA
VSAEKQAEYQRRYRDAHREERIEAARRYHAARREEANDYCRRYYAEHREERGEYRAAHRDEHAEYNRHYRAEHREEDREASRRYYAEHRERKVAGSHRRRALVAGAPGAHTAADVAAQYLRQHGRCHWCGDKVAQDYHVDHVTPLSKGGSNGPENLVIACASCNLSKSDKLPSDWNGTLL